MSHLTNTEIGRLISGRLDAAEVRRIGRHLLTRCPKCLSRLVFYAPMLRDEEEAEPPEAGPEAEAAYDAVVDRAIAWVKRQAPRWREERKSRDRVVALGRTLPPYRAGTGSALLDLAGDTSGWAWVEALLGLSFEARYRDPVSMEQLALVAVAAANSLGREQDHERYTEAEITTLRARAWVELANAYRLNDRFGLAEEALSAAIDFLTESGDLLIHARLLDVAASLRIDQRRLAEALTILDEVHRRYLELGETHLAGRALISKGSATFFDERPREAAGLLRQGLAMINPERDPKLGAASHYNLLDALVACGDFRQASRVLLESGLRQAFADDPLNLLKLRWLEGKIFAGLGKLERGEEVLAEVQDGFLRHGREYEAAVVGLELASLDLRQGKAVAAEELAEEALETFEELKVRREALRAVRSLREAFRRKAASAAQVHQVVRFLQRLEREPASGVVP